MFATYVTYTVIMKEELNGLFVSIVAFLFSMKYSKKKYFVVASKIFSSISVFNILREKMSRVVWQANLMIQGRLTILNKKLLKTIDDYV